MGLSPGNIIKGNVVEIKEGMMMTKVMVHIGGNEIVTVMVTAAALKELDAKVGDELEVIKAPGVIAARDLP